MSASSVFITGVSSGIGFGLAREYLDRGAAVYGLSRREPDELPKCDGFHFVSVDVSDFSVLPDALGELLSGADTLDLAILNAGILGEMADMQETSLDDLKHLMDVNVWSNKVIVDWLLQSGKGVQQIIGMSSGASVNGHRGWNGYSISKAALNMLMKLYAEEAPNVHFTAFAPGLVDTSMQDYLCDLEHGGKFESVERLKAARGTERMPDPESAAPELIRAFENALDHPSGEFLDIRQM